MPRRSGLRGPRLLKPEEALEKAIREALSHCGYDTLKTGKALKKARCPSCGDWNYPEGTNNNDKAVPDLLVFRDGWPDGVMLGLEVKVPKKAKWSCEEQRSLADRRRIIVVKGVRDALVAVRAFEIRQPGGFPWQYRIADYLKVNEGANL